MMVLVYLSKRRLRAIVFLALRLKQSWIQTSCRRKYALAYGNQQDCATVGPDVRASMAKAIIAPKAGALLIS